MPFWKQSVLCLFLVAAAAVAWAWFYPGAPQMLARWGIGWAPTVTADGAAETGGNFSGGANGGARGQVVTAPVVNATINDRLSAIGTGRALRSVVVKPYASGQLTEILVESGAEVEAGDIIARLDSDAEAIAVDRARIALEDAEARLARVEALRSTNTVTAVQQTDAELAVRNARLALREAELALERRSITAPIPGVVGILPVSQGNHVIADTEIATIADRSEILVDFWVPERYAGTVRVGAPLVATSVARANEVFEGTVSAVDNRVDADSRTLKVEGRIENPAGTLRAGMAFQVAMRFPGDTYPAVDPLAIQWGTDGAYVWAVQDGRARRTPVRIIQRNTDSVLVDGEFVDGDQVVIEGIHNVRDGQDVLIAEQGEVSRANGAATEVTAPPRGS